MRIVDKIDEEKLVANSQPVNIADILKGQEVDINMLVEEADDPKALLFDDADKDECR